MDVYVTVAVCPVSPLPVCLPQDSAKTISTFEPNVSSLRRFDSVIAELIDVVQGEDVLVRRGVGPILRLGTDVRVGSIGARHFYCG